MSVKFNWDIELGHRWIWQGIHICCVYIPDQPLLVFYTFSFNDNNPLNKA